MVADIAHGAAFRQRVNSMHEPPQAGAQRTRAAPDRPRPTTLRRADIPAAPIASSSAPAQIA
jgi:hypothetical protein